MKYYELVGKANLVSQIPLSYNDKKLPSETAADVVLLKVHFNSVKNRMQEALNEVVKNIKKEGFDERAASIENMYRVDSILKTIEEWEEGKVDSEGNIIEKPKRPSDEEIAKAEETRKIEKDYLNEVEELNEVYNKAANKQLFEDVEFNYGLSKQNWKDIYDMLGVDGEIEFKFANNKSRKIPTSEFIQYLGELIIE